MEGFDSMNSIPRFCHCGSEKYSYELYDAKGIYVSRVCEDCEEEVKAGFRPEIFEDSNYYTEEPVDND